jgi:dipeptidyl aminopeptidase/acylaminoacyl peptidase
VPILERLAGDRDVEQYAVTAARALAPRFGGASLFYLSGRGSGDGLWRHEGGLPFEVMEGADGAIFEPPAPSPDGRWVAVVRKRQGAQRLTIMRANGTEPRTLAPSINIQGTADWSPQGDWIVAGGKDANGRHALFKIPVDGSDQPTRLVEGEAVNPIWSPSGDRIVYAGLFAMGQVALSAVRPDGTPATLPAVRVSPGGYRFLRSGTHLVYLPRPESVDFWLFDLVTGRTRQLTHLSNRGGLRGFDITPDGKHIVFDRSRQNSDIVLIEVPKK